jgi:N-acetylmuramoyl-L-alanine amidase
MLLATAVLSFGFQFKNRQVYLRGEGFHVVIDAGHGGRDGGAQSKSGVSERDINLSISKLLRDEFLRRGVGVTLTRENEQSLATPFAPNQKKSDMEQRRKIIEKIAPDLVISVHLNNLPSHPGVRGLQTFFDGSGEQSKTYANAIQDKFNKSNLLINRRAAKGDYYILNCTSYPSVLVECGFLSNPTEEKLLQSGDYQKILAQIIADAVVPNRN